MRKSQFMADKKLLILDLDGAIVNSESGIVTNLTHALRSLAHDFESTSKTTELLGPPMHWIADQLLKPYGDTGVEECINLNAVSSECRSISPGSTCESSVLEQSMDAQSDYDGRNFGRDWSPLLGL
jgi:hypothetical protein